MNKFIDAYNFRARLSPSFLALLPLLFGLMAWVPGIKGTAEPLTGAAVAAGVLFILVCVARDAGEKAQRRLILEWGGQLPSVFMLRHRDASLDKVTKARYHSKLQRTVSGVRLPDKEQEERDAASADEQYSACCSYLKSKTRDDKAFPLVKEENMNYGFRRNLYGLRPYGSFLACAAVVSCGLKLYRAYSTGQQMSSLTFFCLVASLLSLFVWAVVVNKQFVRSGADSYATRLLEAIDQI